MKKTPFTETHMALGAKMHEFAGYNMPIEYSGINDEHLTVRNAVGVFDVSHMGSIWVKGPGALPFLQRVTSNDVSKLQVGQAQYSYFPNGKGGIVDDVLLYRMDDEKYMFVVNASNIEKDWNWLVENNSFGAELENTSDATGILAVQGPKAIELLQELTSVNLADIPYYHATTGDFAGLENVILSNTGYTGAGGFELIFYAEQGLKIWDVLFKNGEKYGIKPIGLGARDTLRLEKGYCLYGNDIDDETSPIEAGLSWITKFAEGKDFIDRERLEKEKATGLKRKLVHFELLTRGIPRHGYEVVDADDNIVGRVTSGMMHPETKAGLGLAYVDAPWFKGELPFYVKIRNKNIEAKVIK